MCGMWSADRVLRHLCKLTGQSCTVNSFSPGGKRIVSAWYDYPDKIWDAELETEVRNFLLGVVMVPGVGHLVVLSGQLKPDMCRKWWEEGGWLCRCTRWCRVQGCWWDTRVLCASFQTIERLCATGRAKPFAGKARAGSPGTLRPGLW